MDDKKCESCKYRQNDDKEEAEKTYYFKMYAISTINLLLCSLSFLIQSIRLLKMQ